MRHFPQLATNTAGQYPLRRTRRERVVHLDALDGKRHSLYDAPAAEVEWELNYTSLNGAERDAVDALFAECEGRLGQFLFLDPAANLLKWSEDYSQPAWVRGPALSAAGGAVDPWGTTRAAQLTNSGAASQALSQSIVAPGSLQYAFSGYVNGTGWLRIDSGGVIREQAFATGSEWRRIFVSANPGSGAELVTFSVRVPAGGSAKVTALQAEAQPAPGGYRKTTSRSGVYPNARFAGDEMDWTMQAMNNNAATIRIVSRTN